MLGQGKNVWQAEIDAAVETIGTCGGNTGCASDTVLADFWRFGATYMQVGRVSVPVDIAGNEIACVWQEIYSFQPPENAPYNWNTMEYRPLEGLPYCCCAVLSVALLQRDCTGFVYAITPFNFTAIGSNLPSTPALVSHLPCQMRAVRSVLRVGGQCCAVEAVRHRNALQLLNLQDFGGSR